MANRQLPSKEGSLFRQTVKHYEAKQYKKGIKSADGVLKKFPNHGETLAMKGLLLNCLGIKREEALELVKNGVKNDLTSPVCWHVYGLLHRSNKNYAEASKCYTNALKFDKENQQILRDLAVLQMQMRNLEACKETRRQILVLRPTVRQNWTALAIVNHLLGNYAAAEKLLTSYEETLKSAPPKDDIEHSEALLYRVTIVYESGDLKRALEQLEKIQKTVLDQAGVMELRAKILLEMDDPRAVQAYRQLLDRNADEYSYYVGLQRALGVRDDDGVIVDAEKYKTTMDELAETYPAADAARRLPLDFFQGDEFRERVKPYLVRLLQKGVASTFANARSLYMSSEKAAIMFDVVSEYLSSLEQGTVEVNGELQSSLVWTLYFLAQHFDYFRETDKALAFINRAIEIAPDQLELHLTKARVYKHAGAISKASEIMETVRKMDLKDRFVNSKSSKYLLRDGHVDEAVANMSLFTRNEAKGGAVGDLHDMQCHWFLLESAGAYIQTQRPWLALKRLHAVKKIYDDWWEDQHDFHTYSLRKGPIRAYVDMLRWEDGVYAVKSYQRATEMAVSTYIYLHDLQQRKDGTENDRIDIDAAKKKYIKELRRQQQQQQSKKSASTAAGANKEEEDEDPEGFALAQTSTPLEQAAPFLKPLLLHGSHLVLPHLLSFDIDLRRGDLDAALVAVQTAYRMAPHDPRVHEEVVQFKLALDGGKHEHQQSIATKLETILPQGMSLQDFNQKYIKENTGADCQLAGISAQLRIDPASIDATVGQLEALLPSLSLPEAKQALKILKANKAEKSKLEKMMHAVQVKYPLAVRL